MSDPVTNVEIEDVLASIRRLVSAEDRTPPEAPRARPRPADRLVLTPALRVTDGTEAEASAQDAPPVQETVPETVQHTDALILGESHQAPDDARPDEHNDATPACEGAEQAEAASDPVDTAASDTPIEDTPAVAEETPVAPADAPWKDPESRLFDVARTVVADTDEDATHDDARDQAAPVASVDDLGARIAALEAVVAQSEEQFEPDSPGTDDYAGTEVETLTWEPAEDAPAAEPAPVAAKATSKDADDATDLLAEAPLLDEAARRELIADIVREELQGALGERITRNVRKLVRREIHRAMTIQDLE